MFFVTTGVLKRATKGYGGVNLGSRPPRCRFLGAWDRDSRLDLRRGVPGTVRQKFLRDSSNLATDYRVVRLVESFQTQLRVSPVDENKVGHPQPRLFCKGSHRVRTGFPKPLEKIT